MIENKIIGFVSSKTTYKENDAIFNVLTPQGKFSFKARGISKINSKNAANCNYFMISEYILQSKTENSNKTLKSANVIKMYKKPYDDLLISSSFLFICSMLEKVSESINGYDIAINCFDMLENGIYPINVLNYFLKLLCEGLGYNPNINGCVLCNNKQNLISFDFEIGGFICKNCFDTSRYNKMSTIFLKELYNFFKSQSFYECNEDYAILLFKMYQLFFKETITIYNTNFDFVLKCI